MTTELMVLTYSIYIKSYDNKEEITINQGELDYSMFEKNTGILVLNNGELTGTYKNLHSLAY